MLVDFLIISLGAFRSSLSDALRSEFPQLQASIVTDVLESCNWNEETARDQLFHLAISNSFDSTIKELTEYYSRHGISQELVAAIMEECNDREVAVEFLETLKLEPQPSLLESPSQQVPEAFLWETFPEIDKVVSLRSSALLMFRQDFLTSIFAGVGGDVTRAVDSILVILDETADQVVDPPANASSTPPQEISELPTIDELKSRFPREADSTLRDLKSLAELFPNASLESLRKTLVSARYDSALAAEILFARPPSPSLSSQGSNSLQPLTSWQLPLNGKLKVDLLMKQYPWMDRDLMEDLFVQHNQNVTQTVQGSQITHSCIFLVPILILLLAVGEVFHLPRSPGKPAANTVLKRSDPVLRGPSGLPTFRQAGSTIPTPPPRTPGFSTSYNYVSRDLLSMSEKELLSAGHQAAASRSRLFQEAGAAYQRGDKVLCKRLGDEARSLEVRMREAQKLAAEKVSSLFTRASEGAIPQLDLHGFHVEEALELLEDTLHRLSTRSDAAALRVITGAGYHSGERGPRIKPAVVSYLRRHNLPNYAIGAGAFMVSVPRGWFKF